MIGVFIVNENRFGECFECGAPLKAEWFIEEEYSTEYGIQHRTGRKRRAVDYLYCPCCGKKFCVDDSFDMPWHY